VAARGGDRFYVIDGGTRAEAARKRSDIIDLPCIVFDTETIKEEAAGFVRVNTSRTYLPSVARYKAELVAEDPDARFVDRLLVSKGILVKKKASKGRETEAIATCIRMAKKDKRNFELVISLASQLCVDRPITHTLLDGLFYLSKNLVTKINDPKLENRILKVGAESLELQAIRSRQILGKGGPRIYAEGMLSEINKHLREKFRLKNETS
jgi:hypothetical protein